jgi:hypothetical protein
MRAPKLIDTACDYVLSIHTHTGRGLLWALARTIHDAIPSPDSEPAQSVGDTVRGTGEGPGDRCLSDDLLFCCHSLSELAIEPVECQLNRSTSGQ